MIFCKKKPFWNKGCKTVFNLFKGNSFGKYVCLLSRRDLDEKIDFTLMHVSFVGMSGNMELEAGGDLLSLAYLSIESMETEAVSQALFTAQKYEDQCI